MDPVNEVPLMINPIREDEDGKRFIQITRTVKQGKGDFLCSAACVAMLLGRPLSFVISRWMQYLGFVEDGIFFSNIGTDVALSEAGYMCGLSIELSPVELVSGEDFKLSYPAKFNALVEVDSQTIKGVKHCVVWDGSERKIRDPDPSKPEFCDPHNYNIHCITFLGTTSEIFENDLPSNVSELHRNAIS